VDIMNEDPIDTESNCPEHPYISGEEKKKILSLMQKMMEMGICAVYGQEDEGVPDASVDCESNLKWCRAVCCTFQFALTKEEAGKGHLKHNPSRPFFIARDPDGYCPHLERGTLRCTVRSERPLRCRRYDCREDPQVPKGKTAF
jgi:Fe-S-cluster containining protein